MLNFTTFKLYGFKGRVKKKNQEAKCLPRLVSDSNFKSNDKKKKT